MAYRGALIGFGGVARTAHLPGFLYDDRTRERIEIVAAIDPVAAQLPIAREAEFPVLSDVAELNTIAPIDFVDICTPTASHLPLTHWALEQGYHVLCEKPAALTRDESQAMAMAARAAQRTVMPCHQYRFNPAWQQMRAWLATGAIGHWHLAELSVYRAGADAGVASERGTGTSWRTTSHGGGILLDHGTHLLYTLLDIAGMPSAVRAWTGRLRHHDYEAEDTAQVSLEYPNRLVTLFFTWASHGRENRVRFIGERGTIDWMGGVLRLDAEGGRKESHDLSVQLDKKSYPSWFAALFGTFADAMDMGGTAEGPLEDIARVAALLDAAFASARTGARIALRA